MTERGSDKVDPRVDEELERRVQPLERGSPAPSRAEEFREEEAPAEGQPGADARPTLDDSERRTNVARHLQPSVFPATRDRLLASAREMSAPAAVIEVLERLPEDREFADVGEVWDAAGEA